MKAYSMDYTYLNDLAVRRDNEEWEEERGAERDRLADDEMKRPRASRGRRPILRLLRFDFIYSTVVTRQLMVPDNSTSASSFLWGIAHFTYDVPIK
uniref:Uncharacterized protein n=1 Tax=Caenorhabditis tropicalis TaxID=1561998 RepID=A0A1I7V1C4_9PELO